MITATWRGRFAAASALKCGGAELIYLTAGYAKWTDSKMKKSSTPTAGVVSPTIQDASKIAAAAGNFVAR
jgi:hypothetical protein